MRPLVEAERLTLGYGRRIVVDQASFSLPGPRLGLLGPNVAGKTTLLSGIVGLQRPKDGNLTVVGNNPWNRVGRRRLLAATSFIPQTPEYARRFTVLEHVEYHAWLKRVPSRQLHGRAMEALDVVALCNIADRPMRALSGGMIRRAAIAAALVSRPRLIIMDEPSVGLDPEQRMGFREVIRSLPGETATILSSHMIEDIAATCDHIAVLREGAVVYSGTLEAFAALASGPQEPGRGTVARLESAYLMAMRGAGASGGIRP
jgi:ABC-2 type transport system ATP-binding protein